MQQIVICCWTFQCFQFSWIQILCASLFDRFPEPTHSRNSTFKWHNLQYLDSSLCSSWKQILRTTKQKATKYLTLFPIRILHTFMYSAPVRSKTEQFCYNISRPHNKYHSIPLLFSSDHSCKSIFCCVAFSLLRSSKYCTPMTMLLSCSFFLQILNNCKFLFNICLNTNSICQTIRVQLLWAKNAHSIFNGTKRRKQYVERNQSDETNNEISKSTKHLVWFCLSKMKHFSIASK